MALDRTLVRKIAVLARIRIGDEELGALAEDLSRIVGWIEQLDQVATDGVPPMTSVAEMNLPARNDVVTDGGDREGVLANAPERKKGYFAVPKVVE